MKNQIRLLNISLALALAVTACTQEDDIPLKQEPSHPVPATISVSIPEEGLTKVTLSQDSNPDGDVKLVWQSTDVITVKNAADESAGVEFTCTSGEGTASAEFTAEDITPILGAAKYIICLSNNMPADYTAQTQVLDGSTAHLGYSATLSGVDKYDGVCFSQSWAQANGGGAFETSSVLRIRAQMPTADIADAVCKVVVKSSAPIFDVSKELAVSIAAPGVSDGGKIVTVYATLPPGDVNLPSGTELLFQFQVSADENDKYTAYRKLSASKMLAGGQVNSFKINCPDIRSFAGPGDDGSEGSPYLIGDRHQLDKMRDLLECENRIYFRMVDDVNLDGTDWAPVNYDAANQIDFDGCGHVISKMSIDNSSGSYDCSGFFGLLHGFVHNVVFDGAEVIGGNKMSGIVTGRSGASSFAADFRNVTVRNSSLTSSNNFVGGLAGYIKKSNAIADCHILNTSVTSTAGNVNPSLAGGLVGEMTPNGGCTITDCSAEAVTVSGGCTNHNRSGLGGLIGRISAGNVVIARCHTSGTLAPANTNNVGGLVGYVSAGEGISVKDSYSACDIIRGYTYSGGLVGKCAAEAGLTIDHCLALGNISLKGGYGGHGGLVGAILGIGVTIKNSVAWNPVIKGGHDTSDESSGAVVGYTHPNCVLANNYRRSGITFDGLAWTPGTDFDHPDVDGTSAPLKVNASADESALTDGTESGFTSAGKNVYSYHGKHLPASTAVTPDDRYGWTASPAISGIEEQDDIAENPSYTGTDVWGLGTATEIVDGVTYTNFHGTWEGETREINIITTILGEHNTLGVYYNYSDEGYKYLDEKCEYLDAVAGTNGSMTSQFVRVNDYAKGQSVPTANVWVNNCALTIDGREVDIVKVADNADAATLPGSTVSCAGPLLVWKGNALAAPQEWKDADTDNWLGDTHPRTAIGITKDGKKLIQVTVDGRWTGSNTARRAIGMSTDLLAELMRQLGCYKAMNLDGGGGTQMWVYDRGDVHHIVNHPHNSWPVYGTDPPSYYWIKDGEVARRAACCAVYVKSDLK